MDIASGLMLGLQTALQPEVLLFCFIGVFLGTLCLLYTSDAADE